MICRQFEAHQLSDKGQVGGDSEAHHSWTLALQNRQGTLPDTQLLERLADVHALRGGQFERLGDYAAALSAYSEAAPHHQDYTFKR